MSYSPKMMVTQDMTAKENHWHVTIDVHDIAGTFIETIRRCVFSNEGKQYVTYNRRQYDIKRMRVIDLRSRGGDDVFALKLPPPCKSKRP